MDHLPPAKNNQKTKKIVTSRKNNIVMCGHMGANQWCHKVIPGTDQGLSAFKCQNKQSYLNEVSEDPVKKIMASSFGKGKGAFPSSKLCEMLNLRRILALAQKKACYNVQPPSNLVIWDGQREYLTSVWGHLEGSLFPTTKWTQSWSINKPLA